MKLDKIDGRLYFDLKGNLNIQLSKEMHEQSQSSEVHYQFQKDRFWQLSELLWEGHSLLLKRQLKEDLEG